MNTDFHPAAEQWVGIMNGKLVCHRGIIQFPMRKGWKRGHRMVVLPDYQGIGIGTAFEEYTSQYYADRGWNVNVTTTTPALVHTLCRSDKWALIRMGRCKNNYNHGMAEKDVRSLRKSRSERRITYSFNFKGKTTGE